MEDTWNEIQSFKSKHQSLKEKLQRRKRERQEAQLPDTDSPQSNNQSTQDRGRLSPPPKIQKPSGTVTGGPKIGADSIDTLVASSSSTSLAGNHHVHSSEEKPVLPAEQLPELEKHLLMALNDITLVLPAEPASLATAASKQLKHHVPLSFVEDFLQKFAAQTLLTLQTFEKSNSKFCVTSVDNTKLSAVCGQETNQSKQQKAEENGASDTPAEDKPAPKQARRETTKSKHEQSIESLLSIESAKERENKRANKEIHSLLSTPTAKEKSIMEKFKSVGGAQLKEFCNHGTKEECMKAEDSISACDKLHFVKIIRDYTDESLGDCSFLNTCFHMDTCKYVHYEVDRSGSKAKSDGDKETPRDLALRRSIEGKTTLFPPQWIQCDLRQLDMSMLGKFAVVMADPPWDIHMELPYGTMQDDEMRGLNVPVLQDDGYIFLWVTVRAIELGRECLQLWGYQRIDELIWVKTNQLQRIIRTGRTGHWLNHGKEHCLIGVKGNPKNVNRGLDSDVIVAEVRATSHKPDEIYGIIERLSPGTRKVELFGRPHNVQPNWITLGNQLDGVKLLDPEVVREFRKRYPDGKVMKAQSSAKPT